MCDGHGGLGRTDLAFYTVAEGEFGDGWVRGPSQRRAIGVR